MKFNFKKKFVIIFSYIIIILIALRPLARAENLLENIGNWWEENVTNNPYNGYVPYDEKSTLKFVKKIDGIDSDQDAKDAIVDAIKVIYQVDDDVAKEIFDNADENELKVHIYQFSSETTKDETIQVQISEEAQKKYETQKNSNPFAGKNYQNNFSGGEISKTTTTTDSSYSPSTSDGQGTRATTLDDIIENGKSFLRLGDTSVANEDELKSLSDFVSGILLWIAIAVTLISVIIMGINFLTQSVEDKAKIKESMTPWVVGIIVSFGAYTIWQITINLLSNSNL